MAKRDLTSFEPGDILEEVFRCRNCGSGLSIAIMRAQAVVPGISHCPGCLLEWDTSEEYREHLRETKNLLEALRHFSSDQSPWAMEMVIEDRPGGAVQSDV